MTDRALVRVRGGFDMAYQKVRTTNGHGAGNGRRFMPRAEAKLHARKRRRGEDRRLAREAERGSP